MAVYKLERTQDIPTTIDKLWDYVSSPLNLKDITPGYMNFRVTNQPFKQTMYEGMMITYKVSPLLGIPLNWCTEITHVKPKEYFVDEQREGPYTIWHHEHHLQAIPGGVRMTDIVHYKLPLGILGKIAHILFVRKQLQSIFEFRYRKIEELFGRYGD